MRSGEGGRKWGRHGVDTRPQPYQDQDVRQYDVVTLRAPGPVGLEMKAAVLHEGHGVIVVEGNVGLMSVFPVERHWIGWVCEAIWKLPSAPSTPWQPGTPKPNSVKARSLSPPTVGTITSISQMGKQAYRSKTPWPGVEDQAATFESIVSTKRAQDWNMCH